MFLQIIILVLEFIHLVFGVFGIPIYRMRKGGGLFVSTLLCWGLMPR
jgi:small neutral amino acid transporter SnatA (MarC family)